jgi:hypothetical protein
VVKCPACSEEIWPVCRINWLMSQVRALCKRALTCVGYQMTSRLLLICVFKSPHLHEVIQLASNFTNAERLRVTMGRFQETRSIGSYAPVVGRLLVWQSVHQVCLSLRTQKFRPTAVQKVRMRSVS